MQEWCNTRWVCLNNFEWLSSFSPFSEKPNIYLYIYYIHIYMYMYVYIYIYHIYISIYICRGCGQGFSLVTALHWKSAGQIVGHLAFFCFH